MKKIFCIGLQKTGTTSLKKALRTLGYKVATARVDLVEALKNERLDELLPIVQEYDALQDTPWYLYYKFFDREFPGSKFIVTQRPLDGWLRSMHNHFNYVRKPQVLAMQQFIYGAKKPKDNERIHIEFYGKHYREIKDYFKDRQNDVLYIDISKGFGWDEICPFLGKSVPKQDFPHFNKGDYSLFKWRTRIYNRIINPG